jgi:hypothetical protein
MLFKESHYLDLESYKTHKYKTRSYWFIKPVVSPSALKT